MRRARVLLIALAVSVAACSSGSDETTGTETGSSDTTEVVTDTSDTSGESTDETGDSVEADDDSSETTDSEEAATGETQSFTIEVWADNWMAVYVDGELVGEDSVPITTERSFNSETFTFEAAYPFTLAIEAKDFKETDSGIEYIGESNQQMGDGGIIAQVKDASGNVVSVTNGDWAALVVHQAPLNTDCVDDDDPDATCEFSIVETPSDWTASGFDDSGWPNATVWSAADVDPKIGYDDITWDASGELIWGSDLQIDNTVLLRTTVSG